MYYSLLPNFQLTTKQYFDSKKILYQMFHDSYLQLKQIIKKIKIQICTRRKKPLNTKMLLNETVALWFTKRFKKIFLHHDQLRKFKVSKI